MKYVVTIYMQSRNCIIINSKIKEQIEAHVVALGVAITRNERLVEIIDETDELVHKHYIVCSQVIRFCYTQII